MAGTKRGAHLALSLERLDELLDPTSPGPARSGCRPPSRPIDEVVHVPGRGARPVEVVQPPIPKTIEVTVEVPVPDLAALDERPAPGCSDEEVIGSAAGTAQRPSIWPAVERRLLELVREHRSTIVFANSRRLAERLTSRLNELAAEEAPTDEERQELDDVPGRGDRAVRDRRRRRRRRWPRPTTGRCRASSARWSRRSSRAGCCRAWWPPPAWSWASTWARSTSSCRWRRRRAWRPGCSGWAGPGHQVGRGVHAAWCSRSTGATWCPARWWPSGWPAGAIESLRYPRNPLDVLAQQIVAMVALEPWTVDGPGRAWCAGPRPFAALPDSALHSVLDMLAGRYPSEEFGELRARITWDRVTDELQGRPGAQRLAVTSGGTIPDRGLFTVMTPGGADGAGSRVGELDEEMVYESRVGDTFLLGTSSWRVEDITHDRVIVTPAPGVPARMPFWKGESIGRPLELGRAVGAFVREMSALRRRGRAGARGGRRPRRVGHRQPARLPARAARRHPARAQRPHDPGGAVPRRAGRLAAGGALAVRVAGQRAVGAGHRGPDAGAARGGGAAPPRPTTASCCGCPTRWTTPAPRSCRPRRTCCSTRPRSSRSWWPSWAARRCTRPGSGSAPRARCCCPGATRSGAARCGSSARSRPSCSRWPGSYEQFPVTLEAMRECVQDVYDLPGLRELMSDVQSRKVQVVELATPGAVAVRAQPAVRLRRDVPLRVRRPAGRAAGRGAVAGLHPARRAAGLRGHPRAARPGGAGRGRGVAAAPAPRTAAPATPRAPPTCCASWAT